jgi:hypothetical protein
MPCALAEFIGGFQNKNHLNVLFQKNDVPVELRYLDLLETKNRDQLNSFFHETPQCAYSVSEKNPDDVPIVVWDGCKNQIIAVTILQISARCVYIAYRCVSEKYRKQGWGEFLAFVAIFFARVCEFEYVFAMGVSNMKTKVPYNRLGGISDIDVSQFINITKFGFKDMYKVEEGETQQQVIQRALDFRKSCADFGETVLDLILGDMRFYEAYKRDLVDRPRVKFEAFLKTCHKFA